MCNCHYVAWLKASFEDNELVVPSKWMVIRGYSSRVTTDLDTLDCDGDSSTVYFVIYIEEPEIIKKRRKNLLAKVTCLGIRSKKFSEQCILTFSLHLPKERKGGKCARGVRIQTGFVY